VIVMSSGAAAAIGVPEGISVILRESALLPTLGDRLVVFAVGIVLFGVPLQLGPCLDALPAARAGPPRGGFMRSSTRPVPSRRAVLLGAALSIATPHVRAQTFPSKPIKLVVPYSPGGGADTTARLIAPKLQEALGETVVIDNRPGAGGVIGDDAVAKATPDGHTLLIGAFAHAVNPSLLAKMPFRTPDDFAPISLLVTVPELCGDHALASGQDCRRAGGDGQGAARQAVLCLSGNGSAQHLAARAVQAQDRHRHRPCALQGPARPRGRCGGRAVPFYFGNMSSALPQARAGRVRALAVTSPERLARRGRTCRPWPKVASRTARSPNGTRCSRRAGTPPAVLQRLHAEGAEDHAHARHQGEVRGLGAEAIGSTPQELAAFLRAEMTKWAEVVKAANIKIE
jgi:tripartite-type tricarboxylate transporter receptor subunit TctC